MGICTFLSSSTVAVPVTRRQGVNLRHPSGGIQRKRYYSTRTSQGNPLPNGHVEKKYVLRFRNPRFSTSVSFASIASPMTLVSRCSIHSPFCGQTSTCNIRISPWPLGNLNGRTFQGGFALSRDFTSRMKVEYLIAMDYRRPGRCQIHTGTIQN